MAAVPSKQPAKQAAAKAFEFFGLITFTIGAAVNHVINVAMQLQDATGKNLAGVAWLRCYLSDNANGSTLTATVLTADPTIGTNGVLMDQVVTRKMVDLITSATGAVDLNLTQSATVTYYLVVEMPDGSILVSSAIAFP